MEELKEELNNDQFRVAIFGSARLKPDSPEYHQVFNLARLIASANIDLVTGGGPGLMEAASNGFYESKKDASIHSIGLNIRLPRSSTFPPILTSRGNLSAFRKGLTAS